uniref:Uncharacterized protein n=1 Tax=Melopsittacus undulatus TaxID=13146 RepID=A0A8V5FXW8_MELUD
MARKLLQPALCSCNPTSVLLPTSSSPEESHRFRRSRQNTVSSLHMSVALGQTDDRTWTGPCPSAGIRCHWLSHW